MAKKVQKFEIKDLEIGESFLVKCTDEMVAKQEMRTFIWNRIRLSRVKNRLVGWRLSAKYSKDDKSFVVMRLN